MIPRLPPTAREIPAGPHPPSDVRSRIPVTAPCEDCGTPTTKVPRTDHPFTCLDCSALRAIDAARQMAAKAGPVYDAWVNAGGPVGRPRK